METDRKKLTTQLDQDIIASLKGKKGYSSVNKVIEALVINFLEFLDDKGNIKIEFFSKNGLPYPIMKSFLRNFAESSFTDMSRVEIDAKIDQFFNSLK